MSKDPQTEQRNEDRCQTVMHQGPCGRPVYRTPRDVDWHPVCLMHSRDPNKSDAEFQSEIERILREAGEGEADFTQFVFRKVAYGNKQIFDAKCIFNEAKFLVDASFSDATFMQGANFSEAIFEQKADFRYAAFKGDANFSSSTF